MANVQRMGMAPPPPTQQQQQQQQGGGAAASRPPGVAGQQTIVLARPGVHQVSMSGTSGIRQQYAVSRGGGAGPSPLLGGVRLGAAAAAGASRPVQVPTVAGGGLAGGGNLVINNPGLAPGQPGSQITVPLQALQGLQPGQGIPTGQAGHLLVKTENNQYQILRVDASAAPASNAAHPLPIPSIRPTVTTMSVSSQQRHQGRPTVSAGGGGGGGKITTSSSSSAAAAGRTSPSSGSGSGMGGQMTPDTAKLKCKNFLATLLRLAGEQPPAVATNVRNLIQGLIDAKVEPEVFTMKLQRELNSSPQPSLVPFLKRSLPYLQSSLAAGELTIDGVRAPPHAPSLLVGGNRLQGAASVPGMGTTVRTMQQRPPPASNVVYSQSRVVRAPNVRSQGLVPPGGLQQQQQHQHRHHSLSVTHINQNKLQPTHGQMAKLSGTTATRLSAAALLNQQQKVVGQQIIATKSSANHHHQSSTTIHKIAGTGATMKPLALGLQQHQTAPPGTSITQLGRTSMANCLGGGSSSSSSSNLGTTVTSSNSNSKFNAGPPPPPGGSSHSYSAAGDEDINDVAAMGGVNLAEETQRMATIDLMSNQVSRSCKDETFLQTGHLHERVLRLCRERGLEEPQPDVINLVSHATQERLKTLLEKLAVISEHRLDVVRATEEGDKYEVTQDVRGQLKFVIDLEKMERRRHDEVEREILFRAAKSRTKTEDPEKEKLKAKAKELQRFEEEQLRHEKANNTARLAIGGGPRKKIKTDDTSVGSSSLFSNMMANRPRTKRVHLRDLLFLMEQEKETKRSPLLWKSFCS